MKTIEFKLNDFTTLPQDVIDSVPMSGPADSAVADLREAYDFQCTLQDSIKFLSSYGAWEPEELQDLDSNLDRIVWLAALDCRENDSTEFYMGD